MNALITVFIVVSAVCALATLTYTVADIVMDFYDRRHIPSVSDGDSEEQKEEQILSGQSFAARTDNETEIIAELSERLASLVGESVDGNASVKLVSRRGAEKIKLKDNDTEIIIND